MGKNEALGIPSDFAGAEYMQLQEQENIERQFIDILDLLRQIMDDKSIPEFQNQDKRMRFINWGYTELVYVLEVGRKKYTVLVGQPDVEFGVVKKEYDNLRKLFNRHKEEVVAPIYYMKNPQNTKEAYITPYLYQARCIADSGGSWGVYIPEPEYHFEPFSNKQRNIINACMIATIIKLFDEKNNLGIASCHLGGGDFMLEKGFENEECNYENILKRMKLISAREFTEMTLEKYIETIRREFVKRTFSEEYKDKIIINNRCKIPMTDSEIEYGIKLGLQLRNKNQEIER